MFVLALDSSTRDGSIALLCGDRVIVEQAGEASRPYAERLPGDLLAVLADVHVAMAEIDIFAIASGPGSFTGLRIGIAAMQGLAMVTGKPMVAVSALDAVAHAAAPGLAPGARIGVWLDAYRRDVFNALYDVCDAPAFTAGRLRIAAPPGVDRPDVVAAAWRDRPPTRVAGSGVDLYSSHLEQLLPASQRQAMTDTRLAISVGRLALDRARRGETVSPASVQPFYVRRPDVEVAREQRHEA